MPFFSGVVDVTDAVPAGPYPGQLRDVLGLDVEEWHPLPEGGRVRLSPVGGAPGPVADVRSPARDLPRDLEVVQRRAGEVSWIFAVDHGDVDLPLAASGPDLLTGAAHDGAAPVVVPAGGVVVLREGAPPDRWAGRVTVPRTPGRGPRACRQRDGEPSSCRGSGLPARGPARAAVRSRSPVGPT